jgi:hypothetical protein
MNNWFKIVSTALTSFQTSPNENIPVDRTPDDFIFQTLNDVSGRDDQIRKNKIINNLQVASMHLAYIMKGKLDFVDDNIDQHIVKHLSSHRNNLKPHRLRVPLTMAAFISPICLLMPRKLYSMNISRELILETWQSLGNIRLPAIAYIEDRI